MAKQKINPSAAVRRESDPAKDFLTGAAELKPLRQQYTRFNVFVSEDGVPVWEDFKIYAKSIGMNVSQLVNVFMAQTVEAHAKEIAEAKARFEEAARKHYGE